MTIVKKKKKYIHSADVSAEGDRGNPAYPKNRG